MKFSTSLLIPAIGFVILCYQPTVKAAELCPEGNIEKASEETRTYSNNKYGFSFELPANYRASLRASFNDYRISILDPVSYELDQCLTRRQEITDIFLPEVTVSINPLRYSNLLDAVQDKREEYKNPIHVIRTGNIAGQLAIIYLEEPANNDNTVNVSFAHPSSKYLVTISAPIGDTQAVPTILLEDVMNLVSSTFKFVD